MTPLQTFAPARNRDFNSALIATPRSPSPQYYYELPRRQRGYPNKDKEIPTGLVSLRERARSLFNRNMQKKVLGASDKTVLGDLADGTRDHLPMWPLEIQFHTRKFARVDCNRRRRAILALGGATWPAALNSGWSPYPDGRGLEIVIAN